MSHYVKTFFYKISKLFAWKSLFAIQTNTNFFLIEFLLLQIVIFSYLSKITSVCSWCDYCKTDVFPVVSPSLILKSCVRLLFSCKIYPPKVSLSRNSFKVIFNVISPYGEQFLNIRLFKVCYLNSIKLSLSRTLSNL